jgi:hypothetical protein
MPLEHVVPFHEVDVDLDIVLGYSRSIVAHPSIQPPDSPYVEFAHHLVVRRLGDEMIWRGRERARAFGVPVVVVRRRRIVRRYIHAYALVDAEIIEIVPIEHPHVLRHRPEECHRRLMVMRVFSVVTMPPPMISGAAVVVKPTVFPVADVVHVKTFRFPCPRPLPKLGGSTRRVVVVGAIIIRAR